MLDGELCVWEQEEMRTERKEKRNVGVCNDGFEGLSQKLLIGSWLVKIGFKLLIGRLDFKIGQRKGVFIFENEIREFWPFYLKRKKK